MDPLALVPYALAAGGGRFDGHEVTALVAAGVTLLQRSASLVRALAGRRSGILLPAHPSCVVALAASDGRGAVLLRENDLAEAVGAHDIGAVFTLRSLIGVVSAHVPVRVLLDEAPQRAVVVTNEGERTVDLGSHFGLDLAGDRDGPGAPEECVLDAATGRVLSHFDALAQARMAMARHPFTPVQHTRLGNAAFDATLLTDRLVPALLAGGTVSSD